MRKNIGAIFSVMIALAALAACDDSHHGKPAAKTASRAAAPAKTAADKVGADKVGADRGGATRVGVGWFSTDDTKISNWRFAGKSDSAAPDPLYAIARALEANTLPQRDSVRIADMIDRLLPIEGLPDAYNTVLVTTPWNDETLLLWVAISGLNSKDEIPVSIEFNPESVASFRPLGNSGALAPREGQQGEQGERNRGAMLYELSLQPRITAKAGTKFAIVRIVKEPGPGRSEHAVTGADLIENFDDAPDIVRFAAAIAGFGGLLRGDPAVRDLSCGDVIALAEGAGQPDPDGRRAEIVRLMRRAEPLIELPANDTAGADSAR